MADILSGVLASPIVSTVSLALGVGVIGLWLAAAWWAYADAATRTESSPIAALAATWIVVSTPVLLPLSLLIYRAARPQRPAGDVRSERIAVDLAEATIAPTCPGCASRIDPTWHRCPACATWLAAQCRRCRGWSDPAFDICPLCANEEHLEPAILTPGGLGQTTAAAALMPAAAVLESVGADQWGTRMLASSSRPRSYSASRDTLSASS
ncbi:MAG TPA: hypothetical protein VGM49_01550 [Candidatus Limnocylindrales bacterium]